MKFVIATPLYPPDIGGPSKYAKEIYAELSQRGIPVSVVSYSAVERKLPIGLRHLYYFFRLLPNAFGADAVLALDTWSVGLPALFVARLARAKFMVRIGGDFLWEAHVERTKELITLPDFYTHTDSFSLKEKIIFSGTRFLVRHADRLLFNTKWQSELWQKAYGFPLERVRIVENFYPAERSSPPAAGKSFVYAGREAVLKNAVRVHAAFEAAKQKYPDISLDTRALPGKEHEARVASSYAVLTGSVSDVSPNASIDAIRFGKPFIAPKDSGAPERLGNSGLFVNTSDTNAIQAAIEELANDEGYVRAAANVRAFTFTHSWKDIGDEIIAALN